jgi:transposase-like protein|tara:strand:+ start:717 stop:890 length:174 start_codon:yes stop_codon:yes gene_type:complete
MTNRKYKKDIKDILKQRIAHGDSMHDIAMSLDVDKATVSRWAKKFNIKPTNKFPRGE